MNLFDKVKCNGFYSKVRECLAEEDVDRVEKTYYKHVKQNFCGVIVGFKNLVVTGYLDVIYNDTIDVGIGVLPEQFFVQENPNCVVKCAIVYYADNKKHFVPLEDIECKVNENRSEE